MNSRILRLQGNIGGVWTNLGIDIDREPEGPIRERLESVYGTLQAGHVPSKEDSEFAWSYGRQVETYLPHLLVGPEPIEQEF